MPRLIAKGPDGRSLFAVDLDDRKALLLGRAPDVRAVQSAGLLDGRPIEAIPLQGPSISGNHVLVWCDQGKVHVHDIGSRNGTWLLLPKAETLEVTGPEVILQLAYTFNSSAAVDEPTAGTWTGGRDYAQNVAKSIEQWLHSHGVEVRASVASDDGDGGGPPTRIPLATGQAVDIMPVGTTDVSWAMRLEQLWHWTARQNSILESEEETRSEGMILASSAMRGAHREVVDAAKRGSHSLLLTGASGAGKEMLAEVFHRHAGRTGPFVAVNCAMFSKDLLRSELFGVEPGAYTGATRRIFGAVERAQGGTLFLDEIGEISSDVQPMLLRFLDRREYERLGQYGRVQRADVRVVAATNRDLRESARKGSFRADLWYRLSVHEVEVPPLRTRWDDIDAYLETVRTSDGRASIREALSPEALELLQGHAWEGNFRELRTFAERLSTSARVIPIDAVTCRHALERSSLSPAAPPQSLRAPETADWGALVSRSVQAFVMDRGREPQSWDDQKEWNEKYFKPLLFFHLSEASAFSRPTDEEAVRSLAARLATRVQADRGTAVKQLERYFERFGST